MGCLKLYTDQTTDLRVLRDTKMVSIAKSEIKAYRDAKYHYYPHGPINFSVTYSLPNPTLNSYNVTVQPLLQQVNENCEPTGPIRANGTPTTRNVPASDGMPEQGMRWNNNNNNNPN